VLGNHTNLLFTQTILLIQAQYNTVDHTHKTKIRYVLHECIEVLRSGFPEFEYRAIFPMVSSARQYLRIIFFNEFCSVMTK